MAGRSGTIGRAFVMQVVVASGSLVASVATVSIATRYLGLEQYGLLTAAVVFIGLFQSFTELGLGPVIIRRVANGQGPLSSLIGLNLGFSLLLAPAVMILVIGTAVAIHQDDRTLQIAVGIIAIGLFLETISCTFNPIYDVHIRFGPVAVAEAGGRLGTLTGTILVATFDLGLLAMVAVQIIPMAVRLAVTLLTAPRMEPTRPRWQRAELIGLIRESLPFTFTLIVAAAYWRIDGILLSVLSTPTETGAYGLALQITAAFGFVSTIFCRAVYSTMAESWVKDRERFGRAVRTSYHFMLVAGAPLALFGAIVSGRVIGLLSTEEFVEQATLVTQLFFVAAGIQYVNALTAQPLFAAGQQRFLVWVSVVNLAFNVILNVMFIPVLGAVASGISMVVSETIGATAASLRLWWLGSPTLQFRFLLRLAPPLLLGAATVWLLWDTPFGVIVIATAAVYGAAAFATGAVSVDVVKQMLGRGEVQEVDVVGSGHEESVRRDGSEERH